jgi:hypothetical protein
MCSVKKRERERYRCVSELLCEVWTFPNLWWLGEEHPALCNDADPATQRSLNSEACTASCHQACSHDVKWLSVSLKVIWIHVWWQSSLPPGVSLHAGRFTAWAWAWHVSFPCHASLLMLQQHCALQARGYYSISSFPRGRVCSIPFGPTAVAL